MALSWDAKDPDEVLDYQIDWTARLDMDTIASSSWIVPDGIVKDSDTNTETVTTVWLSGGVIDAVYSITNRVVTNGGRTMDQSVQLKMKAK